ncbi:HAD hydrolase-like protein [Massilia sp. CMS3.1]|uniref:HAD hydrolase-like protein n=1 Tax=Massilia sp. CMS3.1 TaxID=3373083 RepID=UPI003EE78E40
MRAGLAALQQAGYWLGCVTNKFQEPTAALLDIHALAPWFDVVVAGDTLGQMKPAPEPLLHACRALQARQEISNLYIVGGRSSRSRHSRRGWPCRRDRPGR